MEQKRNAKKPQKYLLAILAGVLILGLFFIIAFTSGIFGEESRETAGKHLEEKGYRVVIDAGHGGIDAGAVGSFQGTQEDGINLSIALRLQALLESEGITVIMTREDENAVGATKDEDMKTRRKIISEAEQDATISIHQNFYEGDADVFGPQVFYAPGSEEGKKLAAAIQSSLNQALSVSSPRNEAEGNFYIVKSGKAPAVIVECGFLSNKAEEALLKKSQYQVRIVRAIEEGLLAYLEGKQ